MGWWIYLNGEGEEALSVDPHFEGGVLALGGMDKAEISVTWNYSEYYFKHIDEENGIRWLHEKKAKDTIVRLENAITALGTERSNDYWESTPGNAGHILQVLANWAHQHPEGEWYVS